MKKILYVHYQKNLSEGSAVHVTRFAKSFAKICASQAITFDVWAPETEFSTPGASKSRRTGGLRALLGKYYLREFKVLLQQLVRAGREVIALKSSRPDVVITRYDAETLSIHWACWVLGIPVVTEFNGKDRGELAGTYSDHKQFPLMNRLFSNCSAMSWSIAGMAVSDEIASDLLRCNEKNKPIIVNHNGVDLAEFDPAINSTDLRQHLGISAESVVIGYVGSFIIWHSPQRLFSTFQQLIDADCDVHLLLVGRRLPEIEAMIEALSLEAKERVHYAGFVRHEQIPEYLALMDITVLPNTQAYCSPLKIFEYMAMGKACLVPATSTIRSILVDQSEGWLFDPESDEDFREGLLRLVQDRNLRQSLGESARKRVEAEFTWDHNAERVMQLIQDGLVWQEKN